MIEILSFRKEHQRDVLELILEIQREEFGFSIRAEDQPDLSDIENFYQSGAGGFWVAVAENRVVGTIALRDIGNDQGALRKMFVKASHRGKQFAVAHHLLDHLVLFAQRKGVHELYLGTTERFLAAHRFYEKQGFVQVSPELLPPAFPRMAVDTRFYHRAIT
ncbi:MAG TPA: GNAT family N-acetyltransferase [Noviherbaspirillum sp.]|nr:GNAT family N-acetyltransferase [Noviherbaspirillum sp.]